MPLAIGVREGEDFYVGNDKFLLEEIVSETNFKLVHCTPAMNYQFRVTDQQMTEVMPNVKVGVGLKGTMNMVRVLIDAPKNLKILRGELYREEHGSK